jgi:hypothetical protein
MPQPQGSPLTPSALIGDVIAAPGQEAEILLAARGSANPDDFGHGSLS